MTFKHWKKLAAIFSHAPLRDENSALRSRVDSLTSEVVRLRQENASMLVLIRALRDVNEHLEKRLLEEGA